MKLPMPSAQDIYNIAERTAGQLTSTKSTNVLLIENAVRNAIQVIVDRMNVQIPDSLHIDLRKQ